MSSAQDLGIYDQCGLLGGDLRAREARGLERCSSAISRLVWQAPGPEQRGAAGAGAHLVSAGRLHDGPAGQARQADSDDRRQRAGEPGLCPPGDWQDQGNRRAESVRMGRSLEEIQAQKEAVEQVQRSVRGPGHRARPAAAPTLACSWRRPPLGVSGGIQAACFERDRRRRPPAGALATPARHIERSGIERGQLRTAGGAPLGPQWAATT